MRYAVRQAYEVMQSAPISTAPRLIVPDVAMRRTVPSAGPTVSGAAEDARGSRGAPLQLTARPRLAIASAMAGAVLVGLVAGIAFALRGEAPTAPHRLREGDCGDFRPLCDFARVTIDEDRNRAALVSRRGRVQEQTATAPPVSSPSFAATLQTAPAAASSTPVPPHRRTRRRRRRRSTSARGRLPGVSTAAARRGSARR